MGILDLFRRKTVDDETTRRANLRRAGRIAEGIIFDVANDEAGAIREIFFSYNINGVDYESSQTLDPEQSLSHSDYTPGTRITVRYNPQHPGNSVVV
ncbi:MAG TPA: DUF3592 domain-containing protein [Pyrinomonadaceae bacterium]|nr:DUF3592 domain-containing protein [Pyrinomonadaceae bacterium]